ncbi:MAG: GTP-binding protein [Promethearchaeota archaeon]
MKPNMNMSTTDLIDSLVGEMMREIPLITASAVVDKDGLIIYSKFQDTNADDATIGVVTAVFDSFIARVRQDLGATQNFLNIMTVDNNKIMFTSAGKNAIFTILAETSLSDNHLKVYGDHIGNKVKLILEGETIDSSIPPIIKTLAEHPLGRIPPGEFTSKIIILGDPMVGKTSLIRRYVDEKFADRYISTIGVDITRKSLQMSEKCIVNLGIWDIGGQITTMAPYRKRFYQGANFACVAFDITRRKTFDSIDRWLKDISSSVDRSIPIALIATKMDLPNKKITVEEISKKAESLNCPFILTSARTGDNIHDVFQYAVHTFLERI